MHKIVYYLYCFGYKTDGKFSLRGMGKRRIYTLPYENIEAVITEVSSDEFNSAKVKSKFESKLEKDLKWTEEKIRNHEQVVKEAAQEGPVIPLKFLTLYKTKANLLKVLKGEYKQLQNLLDKLKGKAEWGLKIYVVDREKFVNATKKEDKEIVGMKKEIAKKPEGIQYMLEKQLENKISEMINAQLDKYTKDIFGIFAPFSTEKPVINRLLPPETTKKIGEMISNVSYLILDEKSEEFEKTVDRVRDYYLPRGLWLEYVGPFPPYSFVYEDKNKDKN